jgi:hypothetical protein
MSGQSPRGAIDTGWWRALGNQSGFDPRSGSPEGDVLRQAADAVDKIRHRIDRAFAEDADKWEADHQLALQDIEEILDERE